MLIPFKSTHPLRHSLRYPVGAVVLLVSLSIGQDSGLVGFEIGIRRPFRTSQADGTGRVIVRTTEAIPFEKDKNGPHTSWTRLDEAFTALEASRVELLYARAGLGWVYRIDYASAITPEKAAQLLECEDRVVFAEPVATAMFTEPYRAGTRGVGARAGGPARTDEDTEQLAQFVPNDPLFLNRANPLDLQNQQWNLFGRTPFDPANAAAGVSGISADSAWLVTRGRSDLVAAVLDSGVDYSNPDLRRKIWINTGELTGAERADPKDGGALTRAALQTQGDGRDTDADGFVDNFSGWDFVDNTNNEFDKNYFGHGTGRAGIIAADMDNGIGIAGIAPNCLLINIRVGETFVVSADRLAQGVIYAADHGASVICMALGSEGNSRMLREALDYARARNVFIAAAMANEFAFHANYPTAYNPVVGVGAITHDIDNQGGVPSGDNTFKKKANFSNWGGHIQIVAPTNSLTTRQLRPNENPNDVSRYFGRSGGTSTAVPHVAGVALLVYSRGRDLGIELSAEEVRQIIERTAEDVVGTQYRCRSGWDQWTGYGRLNAFTAVASVDALRIPAEAYLTGPDWYTTLAPQRIDIRGYANARFAPTYRYTIEVARGPLGGGFGPAGDGGLDPAESDFRLLFASSSIFSDPGVTSANLQERSLFEWNASGAESGTYTIRLRVIDERGNVGEHRKVVFIRRDADLLPGFPNIVAQSSGESSIVLADLNGDGRDEIIFGLSTGEVYAVDRNAFPIPGFPVSTGRRRSGVDVSRAIISGQVEPIAASISLSSVAVGDVNGDGKPEIVVGSHDGKVYAWNGSGQLLAGFPVTTGGDIFASPALGDIDGDGKPEIVVGASDQRLYAWRGDGSLVAGFPVLLGKELLPDPEDRVIVSSPALGDLDGDGRLDIVTGTGQVTTLTGHPLGFTSGAWAYAVNGRGQALPGWPVIVGSPRADTGLPVIGRGVVAGPLLADLNRDGRLEVILSAVLGVPEVFDGQGRRLSVALPALGPGNNIRVARLPIIPLGLDQVLAAGNGAVGDLNRDGVLDYVAGTLQTNILGGTQDKIRVLFDHLVGAWSMRFGTGEQQPLFDYPRRVEGWHLGNGPIIADIDDDGLPEVIVGSSGMFLHAFNARGQEPSGWPKFVGAWLEASPAVGDIDGDGTLDVVAITRSGALYAWRTSVSARESQPWPKFRHDLRNTGNFNAR